MSKNVRGRSKITKDAHPFCEIVTHRNRIKAGEIIANH
jgi:hypothetical protein